ncbi:unnamed protein product [Rotaria socialis]|uniref:Uncharacterized protein n=1 Tax=Rotaria socialis TaxID=392032 RepID=A0A821KCN3_9BILA|nr:unnamed protein product [Rotaria socialis]CAF4732642.1 unnamed protein product [Rotaria socialis]
MASKLNSKTDVILLLYNFTVIVVACAVLIVGFAKLWKWLTTRADMFDRIVIGVAYGLIEKLDLTIIRTRMRSRPRTLSNFVDGYRNIGYVLMELDKPRNQAYEEAAKQVFLSSSPKQGSNTVTWLDIGTGPRMFLSQMLLKNPTTKHVHAVEANTNSYEQATNLQQATAILKEKITLHQGFSSSIDWGKCDSAPTAIIHDVLGTISTDEGCLKILRETMATFKNVSLCIPHEFGTLCIPVSRPKVGLLSSIFSRLFGGTPNISDGIGVQLLFNPPKKVTLCTSAQFVERFESTNIPADDLLSKTIQFTAENIHETEFAGFYLAAYVLTAKNLEDGKGIINGFTQNTNWGVKYVSLVDNSNKIKVKKGDKIELCFETDLTHGFPIYRFKASVNDIHLPVLEI